MTARLLWDIFKHVRAWLANLDRAGEARKRQSVAALRRVVAAARETSVYIRQLEETGARDHELERQLARRWTELGFELQDLGITRLADKCQIRGRQWSSPARHDRAFLEKADHSLARIERLALDILDETDR